MMKRIHEVLSKLMPLLHSSLILLPLGCSLFIGDEKLSPMNKGLIFITVGIIALVTYLVSDKNISMEREQNKLSVNILKGERDLARYRRDMIFKVFEGVLERNETSQELNYDPYKSLATILKPISSCFEAFLRLRPKYISVAIFYHFDYQDKKEWNRFDKNYYKAFRSNEQVIFEEDSFGRYVMDGTEGFYLINDKNRDGAKQGYYKLNKKDRETKKKFHKYGSIIGTKIVVKIDNKEYVEALLTISVYGRKIDTFPFGIFREKLECKIEDDILPAFKSNIESELMQIYLKEKK